MTLATLPAPVSESAEQAHLRRLQNTLERWQRMHTYYQARGMRVQLQHARRMVEQAQAALAVETR